MLIEEMEPLLERLLMSSERDEKSSKKKAP